MGLKCHFIGQVRYPPVLIWFNAHAGVFGGAHLIAGSAAGAVRDALQVGIGKNQQIHHQFGELMQRQFGMRDKARLENVALHLNGRGMMHRRTVDTRQAIHG